MCLLIKLTTDGNKEAMVQILSSVHKAQGTCTGFPAQRKRAARNMESKHALKKTFFCNTGFYYININKLFVLVTKVE